MVDRVVAFIDYQNLHISGHQAFCAHGALLDDCVVHPLTVSKLVVARRERASELTQVRVYRGRPSPDKQPGMAGVNDRQASEWTRDSRVVVLRRPLRYPRDFGMPGSAGRPEEKGVDVQLAIDLVRLGLEDAYDAAVLFSRDTDLVPALEATRDTVSKHVEVAGWSGANMSRLRLPGTRLWHHWMNADDWQAVRDGHDYSPPPRPGPFPAALRPRI